MGDLLRTESFIAGVILFGLLEFWRPRATRARPRRERWFVNFAFAISNSLVLRLGVGGLFMGCVIWVEQNHIGFLPLLRMPYWFDFAVTIVVLDFSFYVFHRLMHVWPFLWRFHKVHHTDLDLDFSSASRFHLGELICSMVYTAGVVMLIGGPAWGVVAYEAAKLAAAQFNHSNLRLPRRFEYLLGFILITPAIHWLHHSWEQAEHDSNYSNIFSVWDRLFGTFRGEADHAKLVLGLKQYREPRELDFVPLFALPVKRQYKFPKK